jgi:hypothetical protein
MSRPLYYIADKTEVGIAMTAVLLTTSIVANLGRQPIVSYSSPQMPPISFVSSVSPTVCVFDSDFAGWLKFQRLAKEWREERGAMSSITQMSALPAYQKIIGMGETAIPLILAQLRLEGDEPDQWFWALRALTEANPVSPRDQGNFQRMTQAWLRWGESAGYAW